LSPTISGSYQFSPLFKLRGSWGRSFRAPSYTELYYTDASHAANSELKPEEAWSYEVGMDYIPSANPVRYTNLKNSEAKLSNGANIVYGITYFRRDEEDIIDWSRPDTSSKWQTQNIQKVRITGLETSLKFNFLKDSSVLLNYTLIESDLKEQESLLYKYSLREPRHQISLGLNYSLPLGFLITLNTVYKKRTQEEGFCLLDGKISKRIKDAELFLAGTNLLSIDYEEVKGTPMPSRLMQFGIKTKF
jgi:iron complex outermembrane receptor protein